LLTFTRPGSPFSETELSFSNRDGDFSTATMETMEIEAWQTWEDFTGVFAIHQEKQAWNTVIQHDSTMT